MKGLRLYLPPFAPDDAGAASVLHPLGGLVTILDAGGCAGNLCGFDEPRFKENLPTPGATTMPPTDRDHDRFVAETEVPSRCKTNLREDGDFHKKSFSDASEASASVDFVESPRLTATTNDLRDHVPSSASIVLSAALRDMDAILGRDTQLLQKLTTAAETLEAAGRALPFLALIGTPVPAVIGTDLPALSRLLEQRLHLPTLPIETDGTQPYDTGIAKTYQALFSRFARIPNSVRPQAGTIGVLGATTLDLGNLSADTLRARLQTQKGNHFRLYGMDHDLSAYIKASENERNLVIAPSGLTAARWLQRTFGTPYDIAYPLAARDLAPIENDLPRTANHILILHQQIAANAIRDLLQPRYPHARITCATYFTLNGAIAQPQDQKLREETDLPALIQKHPYDLILGDPLYHRALPDYKGTYLPLPHPAVSGFPE